MYDTLDHEIGKQVDDTRGGTYDRTERHVLDVGTERYVLDVGTAAVD